VTSFDARDYFDADAYGREVDTVLRASWLPMCRADQIAQPGDRFALTLLDAPVVAVRGDDGEVRVFANVCQHRASTVVDDGPGHGSTLICPYHRWAYRLDGTLIGGPLTDGAELDDVCLPAVRHVIWQGFVLVNLDGNAPDPHTELVGLDDQLQPWRWDELVTIATMSFESTWNWKVMVENWIECYHHVGSHRSTVEPYQPARTTKIVASDGAPWVAMTVDTIQAIEAEPAAWIPGVTPERARDLSVWAAFPLLLGGSNSWSAFWLHVAPIDVDHHDVTWYLLAHPDLLALFDAERVEREMDMLGAVHAEDMDACRRVQMGLKSGQIAQFRLTRLEATIASFHRWLSVVLQT
jgi:phenylpropionate dioxygenase-like ring-hydroxylating dioxygenase large terminal subunit